MVIAALGVSQFVMMRQLADAQAEIENVRRKYGYIRVDDESKTYVSRIAENEEANDAYRIIAPAGSRYMLHLSDATFDSDGYPVQLKPTKTISLNGWRDGADVILSYYVYMEDGVPRIVVHTEADQFFNYIPPNWQTGSGPSEGGHLETDSQQAFSIDETIKLMWWRDWTTKRGLILWLEPHSKWEAKRKARDET